MKTPYEQVAEFHAKFDPVVNEKPHSLKLEQMQIRSHFMIEELVEYLASTVTSEEQLTIVCEQLKTSIDKAKNKIDLTHYSSKIVDQADALIDLLYFTYGTFVMMGINPMPLFEIVHQANMGKLFPDGKPHYHPETGKVLKPANWERDYAPETKLALEIQRQKDGYYDN